MSDNYLTVICIAKKYLYLKNEGFYFFVWFGVFSDILQITGKVSVDCYEM